MISLEVKNVRKSYADHAAVDDITIQVQQGAFLTLLGPSGSGKTTLLNIIAGFEKPDSGSVMVAGADVTKSDPAVRGFGMVFQGYALFPEMTVFDNVAFPLRIRRWPKRKINERVQDMLALVKLSGFENRLPRQLSGGQQQRVAFARAVSFDPPLLLLDEPLSALDRMLRDELQTEIKLLHRTLKKTFVYVTHDQSEALALSTDVAILRQGKVQQFGTPQSIFYTPNSEFVANFIGGYNLLQLDGADRESSSGFYGEERIELPSPAAKPLAGSNMLAIRQESFQVNAPGAEISAGQNTIAANVQSVEFQGDVTIVSLRTKRNQIIHAKVNSKSLGQLPNDVLVSWNSTDAVWLSSAAGKQRT